MGPDQGMPMNRFTESLRSSVANGDWYVALSTALTLPDVCSRLMSPHVFSSKRYPAWFKIWMEPGYTVVMPGLGERIFLTGDDCYALRCSYLHEGGGEIAHQTAAQVHDRFHFIFPPVGGAKIHLNFIGNNALQLQIDVFCLEIAAAVDAWALSVAADPVIQGRMSSLLVIHDHAKGF